VKLGWVTSGRIVRVMRFQSRLRVSGMTGWMLRTFCPPLSGPTPKATLSWNGMPIIKTPPQKGLPRPYVVAVIHGA